MQSCEQEVAEMLKETEKSDTELKSEAAKPSLPQWLQNAKTNKDNGKVMDQAQVNLIKTINYIGCLVAYLENTCLLTVAILLCILNRTKK